MTKATNALSDVYAMGGEPKLCLNIMAVPESMPREAVHQMLRGGYDKAYEPGVDVGDVELVKQDLLFDPQTAGGLLISVAEKDADALFAELKDCVPSAQRIGVVEPYQGGKRIKLR